MDPPGAAYRVVATGPPVKTFPCVALIVSLIDPPILRYSEWCTERERAHAGEVRTSRTDGRKDGRTNGRTDGRMDGWMDGRTDGQANLSLSHTHTPSLSLSHSLSSLYYEAHFSPDPGHPQFGGPKKGGL